MTKEGEDQQVQGDNKMCEPLSPVIPKATPLPLYCHPEGHTLLAVTHSGSITSALAVLIYPPLPTFPHQGGKKKIGKATKRKRRKKRKPPRGKGGKREKTTKGKRSKKEDVPEKRRKKANVSPRKKHLTQQSSSIKKNKTKHQTSHGIILCKKQDN